MAGDWLAMRLDLATDPAVIAVASSLGMDEFAVVGRLHSLWVWANQHTTDGHARGVTPAWIDRHLCAPGISSALAAVGWMVISDAGIAIPKFDSWNSESAKLRLQDAKRKAESRRGNDAKSQRGSGKEVSGLSEKCPRNVRKSSGKRPGSVRDFCDKNVTRGEERREEKKNQPPTPSAAEGEPAEPIDSAALAAVDPEPATAAEVPVPAAINTPPFLAAWSEWLGDRSERRKPVTVKAARAQLASLAPLGPSAAVECIRASIANQWQGLFPERYRGRGGGGGGFVSKGAAQDRYAMDVLFNAAKGGDGGSSDQGLF